MKYIKKPIPVEAFSPSQFSLDEWPDWAKKAFEENKIKRCYDRFPIEYLEIETLEGLHLCYYDHDYVVRGVFGELYPVKKEIFEATYEKVEGINEFI